MGEAIEYILEAQGYLRQMTPEVDLEGLLCESDDFETNASTYSMFLESGNTDGSKTPTNDELKSKANTAHKNALQKILSAIKAFIQRIVDFFKEVFGGKDSVPKAMHTALDAAKTVIPDVGNTKIEIVDKEKFFKEAKERLKELNKARKSHDPQKIADAKEKLSVSLNAMKNGSPKTIQVSLQDALKMVESCEDNTKHDTIELKKLQDELEKLETKISAQTATSDNADISAAQFEANAQMMITAEEQKAAQGTTTTFFGALKGIKKIIKGKSPIEKAQGVTEVMDAAANNPRVNKFCKGLSKVGSVMFDDIKKSDTTVLGSVQRAQDASEEAKSKSGIGKARAKGRVIGGYATALNTALKNPSTTKAIGSVAHVGKKGLKAVDKFLGDLSDKLDKEAEED